MLIKHIRLSCFLSTLLLFATLAPSVYAIDTITIGVDLPLAGAYNSLGVDSLAGVKFLENQ